MSPAGTAATPSADNRHHLRSDQNPRIRRSAVCGGSAVRRVGAGSCHPCRGGYHPPVCPRNRSPRGARRPRRAIHLPGNPRGRAYPAGAPLLVSKAVGKPPGPAFFEVASRGFSSKAPPAPSTLDPGPMAAVGCTDRANTSRALPPVVGASFRSFASPQSGKAHSFHCTLAPVAALRFPGQTGPPIAPLLFPGLLYPPLAALRRGTLPTEPASLGFGGGPVVVVTGAAAPRAARIAVTLQALQRAALYRLGPPGRRRCLASENSGGYGNDP